MMIKMRFKGRLSKCVALSHQNPLPLCLRQAFRPLTDFAPRVSHNTSLGHQPDQPARLIQSTACLRILLYNHCRAYNCSACSFSYLYTKSCASANMREIVRKCPNPIFQDSTRPCISFCHGADQTCLLTFLLPWHTGASPDRTMCKLLHILSFAQRGIY